MIYTIENVPSRVDSGFENKTTPFPGSLDGCYITNYIDTTIFLSPYKSVQTVNSLQATLSEGLHPSGISETR